MGQFSGIGGHSYCILQGKTPMKNTNDKKPVRVALHWALLFLFPAIIGAIVQGCIPPPPRQAPKLPAPPGGPNAATFISRGSINKVNDRPINNIDNFSR